MLFDLDHWQEIKAALRANKMRTALTAFGVFWGIFLLLVMLAAGNGLANGAFEGFAGRATNSFVLLSRSTALPYKGMPSGREVQLTTEDIETIRVQVPEVDILAPRLGFRNTAIATRGSRTEAFTVTGDTPQIALIRSYRITAGRFLNPLDLQERRKVAVIGPRAMEVLFEKGETPIGKSIEVNGVYFQVIGLFQPYSTGARSEVDVRRIFVPLTTFQRAFNAANRVGSIAATAREGVAASVAEEKVKDLLRSRHQVAPADRRAFPSFNFEEEFNKLNGLFAGIAVLVWIVGTGTLAAGAIGVSNIMLIVVKERTKEIGIRRAIGARPVSIIGQIVLESLILTTVAGYLGLVAGVALTESVSGMLASMQSEGLSMFRNPGVGVADALQALAILVVTGVLSGLIPAWQAMRVNPVTALRAE